ncbi:MAG: hypothetical protein ACRD5I_00540, partial [Candidatus Acidiferrales bacterium]
MWHRKTWLGVVTLMGAFVLALPARLGSQGQPLPGPGPADAGARVKIEVDLVLVPVTVTDPYNRLVTGLRKEHFEIYEDNQPQEILYFSNEDAPLSL